MRLPGSATPCPPVPSDHTRHQRGRSASILPQTHAHTSHTLLSNLGVNTSQLAQHISSLPAGPSETSRPRRRAAKTPRLQTAPESGPSHRAPDQDVAAWGRSWHETIILSGIENQRQRVRLYACHSDHAHNRPSRASTSSSKLASSLNGRQTNLGSSRTSLASRTMRLRV